MAAPLGHKFAVISYPDTDREMWESTHRTLKDARDTMRRTEYPFPVDTAKWDDSQKKWSRC